MVPVSAIDFVAVPPTPYRDEALQKPVYGARLLCRGDRCHNLLQLQFRGGTGQRQLAVAVGTCPGDLSSTNPRFDACLPFQRRLPLPSAE
jgi:hypothetical protein